MTNLNQESAQEIGIPATSRSVRERDFFKVASSAPAPVGVGLSELSNDLASTEQSISSSNIVGGQGEGALNDEHLFFTSSTQPADLPLVECKMCHGDDCRIRAAMLVGSKRRIHCVPNDCSGDVMGGKGVLPEAYDREG
jgi:hypothetical protein